ncbi:twin-arginine translocation pathway signal [Allopusillimonas ginsengisoli]|nr:YSC84-related protein [Allopusillimonas ginsengisoli]TEA80309.1 twin-arginine translocation pathway signal [Allopusillimonas ginsengisoli]
MGVAGLAFSGCTTTLPQSQPKTMAERHASVDSRADDALNRLYEISPDARSAAAKAKGVLIFPKVLSGGIVVGFERGDGVLRVNGAPQGYYTTAGGSIGFQAGAQSRAIVMLFMTQEALDEFRNSDGWTVGAGATVAVANVGANGVIDSETLSKPVVAFVTTNAGLAAGVSLKGTKIAKMVDEG